MSILSPDTQAKIAEWRSKAAAGTLTLDEMREAIRVLRGERMTASTTATAAKKSAAKKIIPSGDDLLNELGLS